MEVRSTNSERWLSRICLHLHYTGQNSLLNMKLCMLISVPFLCEYCHICHPKMHVIKYHLGSHDASCKNQWLDTWLFKKRSLLLTHPLPVGFVYGVLHNVLSSQNILCFIIPITLLKYKKGKTFKGTQSLPTDSNVYSLWILCWRKSKNFNNMDQVLCMDLIFT